MTTGLLLKLLDAVAEARAAWRWRKNYTGKRYMIGECRGRAKLAYSMAAFWKLRWIKQMGSEVGA